eukprot:350936-Chlamydomonas_euryale.AAC.3
MQHATLRTVPPHTFTLTHNMQHCILTSPHCHVALAFVDAVTSTSSVARSQSLQRAPLTRHRPGSTALLSHPLHTRKGCTTLATRATASTRPCHTSNLLGASRQACLSQARSAIAAQISGEGINLVRPVNWRKS